MTCDGAFPARLPVADRRITDLLSAASFRFRYLLGLLCHVALALVGCTPLPTSRNTPPEILSSCNAEPSFVSATKLKRWQRFPVSVYVDLGAVPGALRESYREGVERGIHLWAEATEGRLGTFAISDTRSDAKVELLLTEGSLPDSAVGITELTFTDEVIVRASVRLSRSHYERTPFLANDVANTTAHEIGHVLGIVDHSPFPEDKMWVAGNFGVHNQARDPLSLLTLRDVNTLQQAYCR